MKLRNALAAIGVVCAVTTAGPSRAGTEDAQAFVEQQHHRLEQLLRGAPSTSRDEELRRALGGFVGYSDLTHRAFGDPCPVSEPGCDNLWASYDEAQRAELASLLEQLVRKTYEHNLAKTLDYEVVYRGSKDASGETRVMTEAKNKLQPREPSVRVDYVIKPTAGGLKVVDIVTEGSSLTKNYYDQFRKKMKNPSEGYPNIVQKLRDKIAKKD